MKYFIGVILILCLSLYKSIPIKSEPISDDIIKVNELQINYYIYEFFKKYSKDLDKPLNGEYPFELALLYGKKKFAYEILTRMSVIKQRFLINAIIANDENENIIRQLIIKGLNPNKFNYDPEFNTIYLPSMSGLPMSIITQEELLNFTPLTFAIFLRYYNSANALINNGANINGIDNKGLSPLHYVTLYPSIGKIEGLLRMKADPNIKTQKSYIYTYDVPGETKDITIPSQSTYIDIMKVKAINIKNNKFYLSYLYKKGIDVFSNSDKDREFKKNLDVNTEKFEKFCVKCNDEAKTNAIEKGKTLTPGKSDFYYESITFNSFFPLILYYKRIFRYSNTGSSPIYSGGFYTDPLNPKGGPVYHDPKLVYPGKKSGTIDFSENSNTANGMMDVEKQLLLICPKTYNANIILFSIFKNIK